MQSRRPHQISSPWSPKYFLFSETATRGGTAPRPEKLEHIFTQSRVPTSSSKYGMNQIHTSGISIKGSGYASHNPRYPVKPGPVYNETRQETCALRPVEITIAENFEPAWEEGKKRPKTQNMKCRKVNPEQETPDDLIEVFPGKGVQNNMKIFEVPIIVVKDEKRKPANLHKSSKYGVRPGTSRPVGDLMSSLDQDFLDLFQR